MATRTSITSTPMRRGLRVTKPPGLPNNQPAPRLRGSSPSYTPPPDTDPVQAGGQTTRRLITSTLDEAKRRARLTGRELTSAETEGMSRGYFGEAGTRLAQREGLALQKRGQDVSAELGYAGLGTQRDIAEGQIASGERIAGGQIESSERIAGGQLDLGYAGLKSTEEMQTKQLEAAAELAANQLRSAEEMHAKGLISNEELQAARISSAEAMHRKDIETQRYTAQLGADTSRHQVGETSGFLGGGGFLGTGIECIIITACTDPKSYEVELAREYRDTLLNKVTLAGYYALCPFIVPLILKAKWVKKLVKGVLVDRLVDQFEYRLGRKPSPEMRSSNFVMKNFLRVCSILGKQVNRTFWLDLHK